ncbi:uncharacterized protein IUM83_03151 [Phytophthora cinnamomi]|uniref:uncharacterized protein n=1 Tax=Phytophthora cinnamomi TaxID=4785 RepID=UPI0035593B99|nr:hypothetical protein IUM83_03151 [Phytophthora cinnamomi]
MMTCVAVEGGASSCTGRCKRLVPCHCYACARGPDERHLVSGRLQENLKVIQDALHCCLPACRPGWPRAPH